MKRQTRYSIAGLHEAQFEPSSYGRVLKNLLGITTKREMDRIEGRELLHALDALSQHYDESHRFTAADVCYLNVTWLASIYAWAGSYRRVNVEKDGFLFAPAAEIPRLMQEFEAGPLRLFTPCKPATIASVAQAVATVHVEFVLIHPFRDGNGRTARLLATLMCLQAGLPVLSFEEFSKKNKKEYFAAIRAGLSEDYAPMAKLFSAVIGPVSGKSGESRTV